MNNNKINLYIYQSLPSGGGKKIYDISIKYFRQEFNIVKIFKEKFIPSNFFHYLFYVFIQSRIYASKIASILSAKHGVLVTYHSWFLKAPYILRYSTLPSIYICNESLREYYDLEHIKSQTLKERLINIIRLPIKYIDKDNARHAKIIISDSKFTGEMIRKIYNRKSKIIYPGLPFIDTFKSQQMNQVITIGALNKYKRQLFYIKVISIIDENIRPELIIICNGYDESYKRTVISEADKLNVKIRILQNVSEYTKYTEISKSKAFLYAPINEPFGIVVLEALSQGIPILYYSKGGGFTEILNAKCGIKVNNLIDVEWAKKLQQILNYPKNIKRDINNNNISIFRKYSDIKMNTAIKKIIKSCI